jgi:hypothetical protein
MTDPLANLMLAKVDEQIETLVHILRQLPAGKLDWAPDMPASISPRPKSLGNLLGHLLECLAGFVAVLYAVHPDQLGHFQDLKQRPVNHFCTESEALDRIGEYRRYIVEGFERLQDNELARPLRTVFVPEGEAVLTLLLGNLEHLVNHKHEIFVYAKLLGVPLATPDLYHFRTP